MKFIMKPVCAPIGSGRRTKSIVKQAGLTLALVAALMVAGCFAPKATQIDLSTLPGQMREGASIELKATPKDNKGAEVPGQAVIWSVTPAEVAKIENNKLVALHEGSCTVTATLGKITAQKALKVDSPLLGYWMRSTQPYKGMIVSIEAYGDELNAVIKKTFDADEEALRYWRSQRASAANVKCVQKVWSEGIRKMLHIKRIDQQRWTAQAVTKFIYFYGCREGETSLNDFELRLTNADTFEMTNLVSRQQNRGDSQVWVRVPNPGEGATAANVTAASGSNTSTGNPPPR